MYADAKRILELMIAATPGQTPQAQLQQMLDDYDKKIAENK